MPGMVAGVKRDSNASDTASVVAGVKRDLNVSDSSEDGGREKKRRIAPTPVVEGANSAPPEPPASSGGR